jgi:hypothetical protein
VERILSVVIAIALPNQMDKHHDHPSRDSNQYDLSGSRLGTPMADLTIKTGVASESIAKFFMPCRQPKAMISLDDRCSPGLRAPFSGK